MSVKLSFYKLPDKSIKIMKDLLDISRKKKVETGVDLCANMKDELVTRNICVGEKCSVERTKSCEKNEFLIGGYHTHISPFSSKLSLSDSVMALKYGIECIGTVRENSIKCYIIKENNPPKKQDKLYNQALELLKKQKEGTLYEKEFKEYMKLEDKIRNKCFDTINVK